MYLKHLQMKNLIAFLLAILFFSSCSKTMDTPVSSKDTADDSFKKPPHSTIKSESHAFLYIGVPDASIDFQLPAFDVSKGKLNSWRIDINRFVSGNILVQNTSSTVNDSTINISRYTHSTIPNTTIDDLPNVVVQRIKQSVQPLQTVRVIVNFSVDDVINSTPANLNGMSGAATDVLQSNVRDLISTFKSNCVSLATLREYTTVTVTYNYNSVNN